MNSGQTEDHEGPGRTLASTLYNRLLARTRLRQLQVIVLVAELGSVHHAAEAVGLTQSAATKMIAEVERVAGTPLFERHARGMRPTFACVDVLPLLRRMLHLVTGCAESLAAVGTGTDGTVRVGAITAGVTGLLDLALPGFSASQPQVHLELVEDALPVLLGRYADGELDVLLVREPGVVAPDSAFQALLPDHYLVTSAPGHPLATQAGVTPLHMLDYPWLTAPLDSHSHRVFERLFAGCDRLPARQPLSTRSLVAIVPYLCATEGLIVAPVSLLRGLLDNGTLVRVDHPVSQPLAPIGLLSRLVPRNRGIAAFCDHLRQAGHHPASASPVA